jgi:hypothetical protein
MEDLFQCQCKLFRARFVCQIQSTNYKEVKSNFHTDLHIDWLSIRRHCARSRDSVSTYARRIHPELR